MATTQRDPDQTPTPDPAKDEQRGILAIDTEVREVNADLAREWLSTSAFDGQRNVKWRNVEALSNRHETGDFFPGNLTMVRVQEGPWRITDGQHRLSVVAKTGIPALFTIARYIVASEDDLRRIYMRTDWSAGARSQRDAMRAHDLSGLTGLPIAQANHLASAMTMLATGFEMAHGTRHIPLTPDQREDAALAWGEYAVLFYAAIAGADLPMSNRLCSSAIMAMGLVTIRHTGGTGEDFWRQVADNDGLAKGSPAHTLVQYLLLTAGRRPLQHVVARSVASCWNAHATGRRLSHIRPTDPALPIAIRGTPFTGHVHMVYPPGQTTPRAVAVYESTEVQP
jgi:hypothetical protein